MEIPRSCISGKSLFILALAILTSFRSAAAQTCERHTLHNVNSRQWQGPLARTVNLKADKLSLTDAIERVSGTAKVRLTYSADALPAGRTICFDFKAVTLGDALLELLRGLPVQPVTVGNNQVALAPGTPMLTTDDPTPPIFPLKPVVVQATPADVQKERPSYSVNVVSGKQITEHNSIAQILNAAVPGVWSWQSPNSFTSQYSVRGASSFGVTAPKVYIDGIEVANPALVTQIAPENVERIEFVRGPQGAALYGGDAINGVANIVTRHTPADLKGASLRLRSGLAVSQTDFMTGPSVGQDHNLSLQLGSRSNTAVLNGGLGRSAEYVPGGYTDHFNFDGNARMLGGHSILTASGRYVTQSSRNPGGLRFDSLFTGVTPLSMQQYTFGVRGALRQSDHFTTSLVLGADGYYLSGVPNDSTTPHSVTDSILRAAGDRGLRTTARLGTVGRFELPHDAAVALTLSAEYSALQQSGSAADVTSYGEWMARPAPGRRHDADQELPEYTTTPTFNQSRTARSLSAQFDAAWRDALFVNAGVRFEDDVVNSVAVGLSTMPMVGVAYVTGSDALSVKFRAAYGKAVRWPDMPGPGRWNTHSRVGALSLSPERQSGVEAGVDIVIARAVALQITHYEQTASGLAQSVAIVPPSSGPGSDEEDERDNKPIYALQNVGEIDNRGWEMQATLHSGAFALTSTLSLTSSIVARVANGYSGDLMAGDKMLGVPARTASIDASWYASAWSASITATRARSWINYDRLALIRQPAPVTGAALRRYWHNYNGFTHLRASFTRDLARGFTLLFTGDNLLGKQLGEPDNLTVVPGRTVSVGVRATF